MTRFNTELWELTERLFSPGELEKMRSVVKAQPLDFDHLLDLDTTLGGACITNVTDKSGNGQYAIGDRDVFRPLQYCAMYFYRKRNMAEIEWYTRDIVEMSGLHIESLLNRIGEFCGFTLGRALRDGRVRRRIGTETRAQADEFRKIYNAAKHNVNHDKDTHLFSIEDAVLAYFVSRKLGQALYHLAKLRTIFATD
jgi:hypothetical protein